MELPRQLAQLRHLYPPDTGHRFQEVKGLVHCCYPNNSPIQTRLCDAGPGIGRHPEGGIHAGLSIIGHDVVVRLAVPMASATALDL